MGDTRFVWEYVQFCAGNASMLPDCDPVWQFFGIAAFLALAVTLFVVLVRMRIRGESRLAGQ